jgi:hypothetical protein
VNPEADRELLERFAPVLRYDSQGSFFADSARMIPVARPASASQLAGP